MIRRIQRTSDLRDLIKSCPSGVIDDIYKIEYYIQGYGDTVEAEFTKKGTMLEVILPTSLLEDLPNGVLMRRAYYKTTDSSFPDGEYNLEFEDNMGVWLGDDEAGEVPGEYVTEEELEETLADYATQDWVGDQGYITSSDLSGYATEEYVLQINRNALSIMDEKIDTTKAWVQAQRYATQTWVGNQGYITNAAMSVYVDEAIEGAITDGSGGYIWDYPIQDIQGQVNELGNALGAIESSYVTMSDVSSALSGYATETWVGNQGYITSAALSGYATEQWVGQQGYITNAALSGYATQSWVGQQGYITTAALSGYATEDYVDENAVTFDSQIALKSAIPVISDYGDTLALGALNVHGGDRYKTIALKKDSLNERIEAGVARYDSDGQGGWTVAWFTPFVTTNDLEDYALESEVSSLAARISALETNYGNAITITNSILS